MNETKNRKYRSIKVGSLKVSMKFTNLHLAGQEKKDKLLESRMIKGSILLVL